MNSSNSRTRLLQHVHPLLPSWNKAWPGWYVHSSPSRDGLAPDDEALQPLRRQVVLGGIGRDGSSSSLSGGAGEGVPESAACGARDTGPTWRLPLESVAIGLGAGTEGNSSACGLGSG